MCEALLSRRHHPGEALRRGTPPQRATSSEGPSADQRFRSMTRARQFQPSDAHCERPEAPCGGLKKERAGVSSITFADGDPSLQEGPSRGPTLVKKEGPAASLNKNALDVHPRINFIFTKGASVRLASHCAREGAGARTRSRSRWSWIPACWSGCRSSCRSSGRSSGHRSETCQPVQSVPGTSPATPRARRRRFVFTMRRIMRRITCRITCQSAGVARPDDPAADRPRSDAFSPSIRSCTYPKGGLC